MNHVPRSQSPRSRPSRWLAPLLMLCLWGWVLGAEPGAADGSGPLAPLLAEQAGHQALAGSADPLRVRPASRKSNQLADDHDQAGDWHGICDPDHGLPAWRRSAADQPSPAFCTHSGPVAYQLPTPRGPPAA